MGNLYCLDKDEIIKMCQDLLFDRKDTEILTFIIIDDLSIKQIAGKIGISKQTVCKRIRRIRNKLKINKWTDNIL
ncbi:hypothetical protein EOL99_03455 [Candidatus Falkowbacteria bacterium]|nr:hypothetical protein [Candidatus Falkowbacteria bacterium]